ncbi:translocation/assembly module TamB domain-containing protein [Cerasicoccus maritimus]|uniref:translocation/assembly module TamB domain-containing protein n=1 Tax=Cerasicoccus maritimus TaxID=490089 RepID=UPI00285250C6|nr:translocation/assembly module TamB domain-containing protein [Cerasicoccus maritimus]
MKRKILKIAGWTIAVVCVIFLITLATADFWAPSIVRPLLKEYGVTFADISREDGHYTLTDVWYQEDGLETKIDLLKAPTPWRLISRRWFSNEAGAYVELNGVLVKVVSSEEPKHEVSDVESGMNLPALMNDVLGYWDEAFGWIDNVAIEGVEYRQDGDVLVKAVDVRVEAQRIGVDYFQTGRSNLPSLITLEVQRVAEKELSFEIKRPAEQELPLVLHGKVAVSDQIELTGDLQIEKTSNKLTFSAVVGPGGYIPTSAHAETTNFIFPANIYDLPDYEQPTINLKADWDGAKADISLNAEAVPKKTDLPPLKVALEAHGDDQVVNVEQLLVDAWSSHVSLSKPLRVELNNLKDLPDAELTVDLNLSDIPEQKLDGRLQGALVVDHHPGEGWPLITANFAGQSLRYDAFQLESLAFHAELDYPQLTIEEFDASTGEGTLLKVTGKADVEEHQVEDLNLDFVADPKFLKALEPFIGEQEDLTYDTIELKVTVNGDLETPKHVGTMGIGGLQRPERPPANVSVDWEADWLEFSLLAIQLKNEQSGIDLKGSASLGGPVRSVEISKLLLDVREQPELNLEAPFTVKEDAGAISISPIRLKGEAGSKLELSGVVDYPHHGKVQLEAKDVKAVWLDLVLSEPLPYQVKLDDLLVQASWNGGPLEAKLKIDAGLFPENQDEVELLVDLSLQDGHLALPDLRVMQGEFTLMEAKGAASLLVTPAGPHYWTIEDDAPIHFTLFAEPDDSPIWNWFEEQVAVDFIHPIIDFQISGNVSEPVGRLDLKFDALEAMTDSERKLPQVQKANVVVNLSPEQIAISRGEVNIAGRPFTLVAQLPMGRTSWEGLINEGAIPDWSEATGELRFTDVPLNAFTDFLPDVLRDEGTLSLTGKLSAGQNIQGGLDIEGVKTRPLAQLGSINDINASFRMEGRTLSVKQADAVVGGAPIGISGVVNLSEQWKPLFDLKLSGENVPLARSPGLILRASPSITLKTDGEGITTIGGVVALNESFFTKDLASFQQGGGGGSSAGGGSMRPPYFSIEDEPLADWRLHLKIEGDRFLRVRVPTFEGVVSADFDMRGPLRRPLMYGQAELEHGIIMFPFATLRVDGGAVEIPQNDPDVPMLNITASGRAYGYDIQLRVTGTANEPIIAFTSTPSLEQSDIILMVTSGQIPNHDRSAESRLSGIGIYIGRSFLVDLGLIDPLDDVLTVNIGEDVSTSGKDTINIRYKLNDDWDVVGAYDKYDAYYLDFEYTIYRD